MEKEISPYSLPNPVFNQSKQVRPTIEVAPLVEPPDQKSQHRDWTSRRNVRVPRGQIIDLPISEVDRPLSLGHFATSIDFPFLYEYLEVKTPERQSMLKTNRELNTRQPQEMSTSLRLKQK